MPRRTAPRRLTPRLLAAAFLVLLCAPVALGATGSGFTQTVARLSAFSTQATDWFCTAAVVQHVRNLATGEARHGGTQQADLYQYGRAHNMFRYPTKGVDPLGVEAMLEYAVAGSDWRWIRTHSLQSTLIMAARRMRATGLPVVLFVAGGKHVWTMNGYTATRDPASGRKFTVTQVRVSGPFYPKQKSRYGWFDLPPNTVRSASRLAEAFFPYREHLAFQEYRFTPWNGYFVAVVPWTYDPTPDPDPDPDPSPTPTPTPDPSAVPDPTTAPSSVEPSLGAETAG
jgi:hypothetical protein